MRIIKRVKRLFPAFSRRASAIHCMKGVLRASGSHCRAKARTALSLLA
jgi:hypothetical protein